MNGTQNEQYTNLINSQHESGHIPPSTSTNSGLDTPNSIRSPSPPQGSKCKRQPRSKSKPRKPRALASIKQYINVFQVNPSPVTGDGTPPFLYPEVGRPLLHVFQAVMPTSSGVEEWEEKGKGAAPEIWGG